MEKNEIITVYGKDPAEMAIKLAEAADLAELISSRFLHSANLSPGSGKSDVPLRKVRIGLKPNLVVSRPAQGGATTHPEIAAALISYLRKNGFDNIAIIEGSWAGDSTSRAFSACGYLDLAKETGVELIDTQADKAVVCDCKGMKIEICESALAVDFMINLPVLKGHCQTLLTCALKNNKGIIPDREKRRFHSLGLHKPIAHLNTVARNDFIIVDGICGDLDFEEGGNPLYAGRMFASMDPVLCDAWAAELMGYSLGEIPYIALAEKLGVGVTGPVSLREINKSTETSALPKPQGKVNQLSAFIGEDNACSPCYAGLVYALSRLGRSERERLDKVCIGQGFKGKKGKTGVGQCTAAFTASCPGCPPTGQEILVFLKRQIRL